MRLDNETPFPAKLYRTSIDDHRLAASLALRVTYQWANGQFEPAAAQDWILSDEPWDTPYGKMAGDNIFYRDGVDIFILGEARPPQGQSANVIDVQAALGSWRYGVRVFGDRYWRHSATGLVPSPPAPVERVKLNMANAFGGMMKWDGLDAPFGPNPEGKGCYIDEATAAGKPLPNIEDPAQPIRRWDDRPMPVGMGLCPPEFAGKFIPLMDKDTQQPRICGRMFNAAFPAMIAPAAAPGDVLTVRGISAAPELRLKLPTAKFEMTLRFDDEIIRHIMPIDQLGLEFGRGRMFVTYRFPFRYVMHPRQQRSCVLRQKEI